MARVYMAAENYEKAEPLLEQAISMAKMVNSDEELSACLLDASWLLHKQNRLDKAEQLCELGLKLQQKIYFSEHPYIAYTFRNLSKIHRDQTKFELAREELEYAIEIMRVTHQPEDTVFGPFQADLAALYAAMGDYVNAQTYYESALKLIVEQYGSENLYTAKITADLAKLYNILGKHSDAEKLLVTAVPQPEKLFARTGRPLAAAGDFLPRIRPTRSDSKEPQAKRHTNINSLLAVAAP
ncbi:MAG: tetratricopeptide repeat protein [Phycisphaerae bacterium]|nr:tetratricopeptide repeat protein [Phycisphaerae bacterium]